MKKNNKTHNKTMHMKCNIKRKQWSEWDPIFPVYSRDPANWRYSWLYSQKRRRIFRAALCPLPSSTFNTDHIPDSEFMDRRLPVLTSAEYLLQLLVTDQSINCFSQCSVFQKNLVLAICSHLVKIKENKWILKQIAIISNQQ